ncbi:hypothetical protein ZWY2020_060039 [Hordeum vulgare]|nr:hypothetical protein ZWY2020_060039 [Hordeum vulgare]
MPKLSPDPFHRLAPASIACRQLCSHRTVSPPLVLPTKSTVRDLLIFGVKASVWYLAHSLGVAVSCGRVANAYIGLHTHFERTGRSVGLWTALLTAEVSAVALVYLLQDRWNHIVRQEEAAARDERRSETETSEEPSYPGTRPTTTRRWP